MKKNYMVHSDFNASGTSLVGTIEADYYTLVELFGEPTWTDTSSQEKVNYEWVIQFDNGTLATIYNWKDYDGGRYASQAPNYEWHVGGFNKAAEWSVREVLLNANS